MSSELNSKEISGTIQRFFLLEINILAAHALSKSKMILRRQGGDDPTCSGQTSGVYVYTLSKPMTPPGVPRHSRLCRNYYFVIPCKRSATRNPVLSMVSWIPAFAGMTIRGVLQSFLCYYDTVSFAGVSCRAASPTKIAL
jgi:hypothetical protein